MNKLILICSIIMGTHVLGYASPASPAAPASPKTPTDFVPSGYVVVDKIIGDLNKDNQPDYILIIKATEKSNIIQDRSGRQVDRNRRGIVILFKKDDRYELALKNSACFSSENEDGGVYFSPELDISIRKGNLYINYGHGRYGYWAYTFRYQNANFELIGYDDSQNRGPLVERTTSINFLTKKMLTKENINPDAEEGGDEKFKETWKKITFPTLLKLKDISDFDTLNIKNI